MKGDAGPRSLNDRIDYSGSQSSVAAEAIIISGYCRTFDAKVTLELL